LGKLKTLAMATLADGRIVLWEGGSLWVMQVPALPGAKQRTDFHAHHALQITLALEGEFELHLPNRSLREEAVMVAADANHAFEPRGLIALLFVDPESAAGRWLANTFPRHEPVAPLAPAQIHHIRASILELWRQPVATREQWRDLGQSLIRSLTGGAAAPPPDDRVQASLDWAEAHLDERLSVADVAEVVGLSIDRMSHLFVEQTGLAFRTYLLWLRMRRAVEAYAEGAALTAAAHEAGFADSAHFSRTFRRMFGVAAAELRLA
jgi:AraC-like DNA-binding protein